MSSVVIVGNGPAAHRLVERLRAHGHEGAITVLGAEPHPAYNRVLLGSVLDGTLPAEALTLPDLPGDVALHLGVTATGIDPQRHEVRTDNGQVHHYDELVLATGARPRIPEVPGLRTSDGGLAAGVTALRTLDDCVVGSRSHAVVLGGGILGVETARGLLGSGFPVTLVHPKPHPMDRQVDAEGGQVLAGELGKLGMSVRLRSRAVKYEPGKLVLDDGEVLKADPLVLCVGVLPETGLARAAGLETAHGVVVDEWMRTSAEHVHALGDCAEHDGEVAGLIAPAWDQAEVLAARLTGGSDRYGGGTSVTRLKAVGLELASVGSPAELARPGAEVVTISDPARGRYAKLALHRERVAAAVLIGFPRAIASIVQLHDADLPVPSDRLGLLLGTTEATPAAPAELGADALLCRCNTVTRKALETAWHSGARDVPALAKATRATTGCGGCTGEVRRLCDSLHTKLIGQEGAA